MRSSEAELQERLLEIIGRGAGAPLATEEFEELALEIFAFQYQCNPIYRAYCEARGAMPETVEQSGQIPAVPTDAFKSAALTCGDPASAAAVFRTSGTTAGAGRRGTHYLSDTRLYRAALRAGFRAHLLPDRETIAFASFVPSPSEVPDSSLSFMVGDLLETVGEPGSAWFISADGTVRTDAFLAAAHEACEQDRPLLLIGTSFAFVHLLDRLGEQLQLPAGSRIMDTGGFKGRSREVARADLYASLGEAFGIPLQAIINEYGMTEMSSQLYDGRVGSAGPVAGRVYTAPAWLRTEVVDPETLAPLGEGQIGILRHLDLANLHSICALQSADLGRITSTGIELLGRAEGAEPRGCSIAMDELLAIIEP